MNLNDLNEKLYKTLEGLEDGSIEPKKAQAIVNVNNAINGNCKLILDAAKLSKNPNILGVIMDADKASELEYQSTHQKKTDFALSLGYKNLAEAIGKLGLSEFERRFRDEWKS